VANPFSTLSRLPNLRRIDRLTVTMDDYVTRMHLYVPETAKRRLMIVHQGHNHQLAWSEQSVRFFLAQGYLVLIIHMPLYGPNTGPFDPHPTFHDQMFTLETPTVSPFKYFFEPVVRAVNYAERILNSPRVYMMGFSGGGWATVLSAALDPRIMLSISVAGSLPLYLRRPDDPCALRGDRGDREQYHPELYAIADYLDLYILASYGPGRGHLQVLNQFDSCCFAGVRFLTYRDIVKSLVAPRRGRFDVFLDSSHESHTISPYALEKAIIPFLRRRHL
jgi:dienelactone hydrolase